MHAEELNILSSVDFCIINISSGPLSVGLDAKHGSRVFDKTNRLAYA